MIKSYDRSIKLFTVAEGFLGWLCPVKVTYPAFFSPPRVNLKITLIPEDDLTRIAKFRKMTYRDWQNPAYDKLDIERGFDETNSLMFQNERFRLV
jgi:hypothetical protein